MIPDQSEGARAGTNDDEAHSAKGARLVLAERVGEERLVRRRFCDQRFEYWKRLRAPG
jgi:hypothetical protein